MSLSRLWTRRARRPRREVTPAIPLGAGLLSCTVVDPLGDPLGAVSVTVTSRATDRTVVTGTTDPYGLFAASLPPGEYAVLVTGKGLSPCHRVVRVAAGERHTLGPLPLEPDRSQALPAPGTWLLDPPHTAIRFVARHVGMANVYGSFLRFNGSIQVAEPVEDSQVELTIDASSISTGNQARDAHLRSEDFLDVARYPYIHFASSRVVHHSGSEWSLIGSLTLHGVTRSVTLDTTYLGAIRGGYDQELRCAARATAELHREDFTLDWRRMLARGIAVVGPTVRVELDVQAMYANQPLPPVPE